MEEYIAHPGLALALDTLIYIISAFVLFFIGKVAYGFSNRKIDVTAELVKKDNLAFALSNVGFYIGLLLAIGSVIIGPSYGILIDVIDIFVFGFVAIILLLLSEFIMDKVILAKFSTTKEIIEDQNAGTGILVAANFIASGLIIMGAMIGEGKNFFPDVTGGYIISGVITAIVFWITGQVVMIIAARFYNLITPYNIHDHIEKDNVAVGIGSAGALIAMAILISNATSGDFISWQDNFTKVAIEVVIGFILLPVVRFIADKILLPGEKLTDEIINQENPNIGAAIIEAFAYIGGAVLITWCL
ncbi:MAG: DUF350 domain-containing protein [Bacteroidales bacterium]|nr:DUF350 domain-containing protein [Bacteroidales bacterium]